MTAPVQVGPSQSGDGPRPRTAPLTYRYLQVLQLAANGYPNRLIADRLGISENTVKSRMKEILRHLHVNDRTEAVARVLAAGLIHLDNYTEPADGRSSRPGGAPTVEQLLVLVARAERKGGLDYAEGARLREGLRTLTVALAESEALLGDACAALRRAALPLPEKGAAKPFDVAGVRRVTELAKRWLHIPGKRAAGQQVLAALSSIPDDAAPQIRAS